MAVFSKTGGSSGGSYAKYFTAKLTVTESSYSIPYNNSPVDWKLELISGSSGKFSDYWIDCSVELDGKKVTDDEETSGYKSITTANTAITLAKGKTTIDHNSDGSKKITCKATINSASGTYSPRRL